MSPNTQTAPPALSAEEQQRRELGAKKLISMGLGDVANVQLVCPAGHSGGDNTLAYVMGMENSPVAAMVESTAAMAKGGDVSPSETVINGLGMFVQKDKESGAVLRDKTLDVSQLIADEPQKKTSN